MVLPLGMWSELVPADLIQSFAQGRDTWTAGERGAAIIVSLWILGILVAVLWS